MTSTLAMILVLLAVYLVGVFTVYFILSFFVTIIRFIRNGAALARQNELERAFLRKQMAQTNLAGELAEKNTLLEKQIGALKKDLREAKEASLAKDSREAELNQKLASLNRRAAELEHIQQDYELLNKSKKRETADIAYLKERNDAYAKQIAQLQEKYDKLLLANETMTEQAAKLRIKYEVAAATLETLRTEIKEADQRQSGKTTDLVKGMQEALDRVKNEKKELQSLLKQQVTDISALEANNDAYAKQLAQLQEKHAKDLARLLQEEKDQVQKLKDRNKQLEDLLKQQRSNKDNEKLEEQLRLSKEALEQKQAEIKNAESEKEALKKEIAGLKQGVPKETWKPAETPVDTTPEIQKNSSWQAWVHRFTLGHLGERIWITRGEFEDVEEEIRKKDGHVKKYSNDLQETEHKVA